MSVPEKNRWRDWAVRLRQEMMTTLTPAVTKSVVVITNETATTKAERTLKSARFWTSCQEGKSPNDSLSSAGFEIEFTQDEKRVVQEVTFRLNETWMTILDDVRERNAK